MMIEAAAQAAWSTDRGQPIAAAVVTALRAARVTLPATGTIERTAIAGRARARARATNALLTGISDGQMAGLDRLLVLDPSVNMTSFGWLKSIPIAPKADHIHGLLDRLKLIRGIGLCPEITSRISEERRRQFVSRRLRFRCAPARALRRATAARNSRGDRHRHGDAIDGCGVGHGG
jgi:hypothetical protein